MTVLLVILGLVILECDCVDGSSIDEGAREDTRKINFSDALRRLISLIYKSENFLSI